MDFNAVLDVVGFAISLAGFVRELRSRKGKETIILVAFASLITLSTISMYRWYMHNRQVNATIAVILGELMQGSRTVDDLRKVTGKEADESTFTEALARAWRGGLVEHHLFPVHDDYNRRFEVTLFSRPPQLSRLTGANSSQSAARQVVDH